MTTGSSATTVLFPTTPSPSPEHALAETQDTKGLLRGRASHPIDRGGRQEAAGGGRAGRDVGF